jgi:hypothetical protein
MSPTSNTVQFRSLVGCSPRRGRQRVASGEERRLRRDATRGIGSARMLAEQNARNQHGRPPRPRRARVFCCDAGHSCDV